jgi:hypothetical protein
LIDTVRHLSRMSRSSKILVCAACLVVAAIVCLVVVAHHTRQSNKIPRCHDNLRQIELAKLLWAGDEAKTTNDTPTWNDLRLYFPDSWSNSIPVCPAGGTYTIGRVGEQPRCSVGGGYDHSLQ